LQRQLDLNGEKEQNKSDDIFLEFFHKTKDCKDSYLKSLNEENRGTFEIYGVKMKWKNFS